MGAVVLTGLMAFALSDSTPQVEIAITIMVRKMPITNLLAVFMVPLLIYTDVTME
jgi:hypothetical protein